uniref:tRNA:m(4)X modification enzyme TRM13 n=1 Tax=Kalanchoe fedtschenkoi TaxID=63787 RepID=A0A7N0USM8_KALFE
METRCKFWLPKKNRNCSNACLKGSSFCGNHTQRSDEKWVQCPVDPSHCVLEQNLEAHVRKCPLVKQVKSLAEQRYYQKGINGGDWAGEVRQTIVSSETKRTAVYNMSVAQFSDLLRRIEAVYASICGDIGESYKVPEACGLWIKGEVDRNVPFQEKHVVQQASILGNLEELGVLEKFNESAEVDVGESNDENVPAVVEFGAGRGYLTQMLADCYGVKKVFLVERKAYKLKAERSLRQKESLIVERLKIDIEDLNLDAVESLWRKPYLAVGKHLCGPATDLTIKCTLRDKSNPVLSVNKNHCKRLHGLAIATCCHHLCQWVHYANKKYFLNLGFTEDHFNAITWFTSWAVDADHGSNVVDAMDSRMTFQPSKEMNGRGTTVDDVVRSMSVTDRAILGFKCKEIIDMGRLLWLKEHTMESRLVKYVPSNISPENHLLVARGSKHSL